MESFIYHTDPGHGWVQVPCALLTELGIADKISKYSYKKGDLAFLEEDLDATVFVDAYTKQKGYGPVLIQNDTDNDSFVRSLQSFS